MKNIFKEKNQISLQKKLNWEDVQHEMKKKFGKDIYDSWLKKIEFIDEFSNYILISVATRFIRDWITSRYLDQILNIVQLYKKEINRLEFSIKDKINDGNELDNKRNKEESFDKNVSFIKDSFLQYNRFDPNKNFENFILGSSNKLAYEASKKVTQDLAYYNPLYLYGGVGMGKTHLLNAIGLNLKQKKKSNVYFSRKIYVSICKIN